MSVDSKDILVSRLEACRQLADQTRVVIKAIVEGGIRCQSNSEDTTDAKFGRMRMNLAEAEQMIGLYEERLKEFARLRGP